MAITLDQVQTSARDLHDRFDETMTSSLPALRFVQRTASRLFQRVLQIHPHRFEKCHSIDLSQFDWDNGEELPEAIYYKGRTVHGSTLQGDFFLIDPSEKIDPPMWPSGYLKDGRTLCLVGDEKDWTGWETVKIGYVPALSELVNEESVFTPLPDEALDALVANLALFLARRLQGKKDAPPLGPFKEDKAEAEDIFFMTIANQKTAEIGTIQPVW